MPQPPELTELARLSESTLDAAIANHGIEPGERWCKANFSASESAVRVGNELVATGPTARFRFRCWGMRRTGAVAILGIDYRPDLDDPEVWEFVSTWIEYDAAPTVHGPIHPISYDELVILANREILERLQPEEVWTIATGEAPPNR